MKHPISTLLSIRTLFLFSTIASSLLPTALQSQTVTYTTISPPKQNEDSYNAVVFSGDTLVGNTFVTGTGPDEVLFTYSGGVYTESTPFSDVQYFQVTGASGGGNVVGYYQPDLGAQCGFLYNGGSYTTLSVSTGTATTATGVSGGNVIGSYEDGNYYPHGFLYKNGAYIKLEPPNIPHITSSGVTAISGNNVLGQYNIGTSNVNYAFVYDGTGFTSLPIDAPGAAANSTAYLGISGNNILGLYVDSSTNKDCTFIYSGGTFSVLSLPPGAIGMFPSAISGNDVVGWYSTSQLEHGFYYSNGTYITIDPPDSYGTSVTAVSDNNILGSYKDFEGIEHWFLATISSASGPTLSELATLCSNVYTGNAGIDAFNYIGDNTNFISGYNGLVGFRAAVYTTPDETQVVIAFRGTDLLPLSLTTVKNIAADLGFGGTTPSPTLVNYAAATAAMVLAVVNQYPNANITLTGHSLGGALAQSGGAASGLTAYAFNAPGTGAVYQSLYQSSLNIIAGLGSSAINSNYRIFGDQISLLGSPIAIPPTTTTTLAWPNISWEYLSDPRLEAMANMSNILYLHNIATIIDQVNTGAVSSAGQPNDASALENWVQGTIQGNLSYLFAFGVSSALDMLIDPSGQDIVFDEQTGSPSIASIDLPTLPDVAWYGIQYQISNEWSPLSLVEPGYVYQLPANANGVVVIPMDGNGDPVTLADFLFDLAFSTTGTVSADLTDSNAAPALPPFQSWQIAHFGENAANPNIAADNANPTGDGIVNLMKYALGMDPNVNSRVGIPVANSGIANGMRYFTFTYNKVDAATDITYAPQWSVDLINWSSTGITEQILSDNGTLSQVQDQISVTSGTTVFMRLQITRQ